MILTLAALAAGAEEVSSPEYLALPAKEKAARLWANCLEDTSSADWLSSWAQATGLMAEMMCPTFTTPGDELPRQGRDSRVKTIHTVGTVGRVEWRDRGGHNYT